jgi:NTP pyrophosphatase (non-canonical NTP hydrolase)
MENLGKYLEDKYKQEGWKDPTFKEGIKLTKSVVNSMLDKFGEDSQIDVSIEEMSELIKELIKYKRSKIHFRERQAASREHVVEEIGDVMFMMEYLKAIFCISDDEIKNIIALKAVRTKARYLDV